MSYYYDDDEYSYGEDDHYGTYGTVDMYHENMRNMERQRIKQMEKHQRKQENTHHEKINNIMTYILPQLVQSVKNGNMNFVHQSGINYIGNENDIINLARDIGISIFTVKCKMTRNPGVFMMNCGYSREFEVKIDINLAKCNLRV